MFTVKQTQRNDNQHGHFIPVCLPSRSALVKQGRNEALQHAECYLLKK